MLEFVLSPIGLALFALAGGMLLGGVIVAEVIYRRRRCEVNELREALEAANGELARRARCIGERDNDLAAHDLRLSRLVRRMVQLRETLDSRTAALATAEDRLDELHAALAHTQREQSVRYAAGLRFRRSGSAVAHLG